MRCQRTPQDVRQPVDEWDVAKDEAPTEIDPVRLEEIHPIRREDDDAPARPQHSERLGNRLVIVVNVLYDLVQQDNVEAPIRVWETLSRRDLDVRQGLARLRDALRL